MSKITINKTKSYPLPSCRIVRHCAYRITLCTDKGITIANQTVAKIAPSNFENTFPCDCVGRQHKKHIHYSYKFIKKV